MLFPLHQRLEACRFRDLGGQGSGGTGFGAADQQPQSRCVVAVTIQNGCQLLPVECLQVGGTQASADPVEALIAAQFIRAGDQLRSPFRFQQLQLGADAGAVVVCLAQQGDSPFQRLAQWVQGPQQ